MGYLLETLNRGNIYDCGVIFGDSERVRIGDLPAMPMDQFAQYSTETLTQILLSEETPQDLKDKTRTNIAFVYGRLSQAVSDRLNIRFSPEENQMIEIIESQSPKIALQIGNPERKYQANPFVLQGNQVNISNLYTVALPDFVAFATYILGGSMFGWTIKDVPKTVKDSVQQLMETVVPFDL